jgi:branched-chain amino acid transport system substrate-binding protein
MRENERRRVAREVNVALIGSFTETSFADLLQLYGISRQTVALTVTLRGSERPDGVFYFETGELVGAYLSGVEGREAVRRALRLHDGKFRADPGVAPPAASRREGLRSVVGEELMKADEEKRAATATVATPASWDAAAVPPPLAPPPRPARAAGPVEPAKACAPARRPPPGGTAPAAPSSRPPGGGWRTLLAVGTAVVLVAGLAVGALALRRSAAAPGPATEAVPAASGVRGVSDREIVLGMVTSLTGSNKERGRAMRAGWEAALAAANAAGGVHGRSLRLVVHDDGYDPARTLPAMKEVLEGPQPAFAIVGNVGTATAAVAVPYAAAQKAVFFGPLSGADLLRRSPPERYAFNVRASLAAEGAAAIRYLADVRRVPAGRIAVVAQEDDFGASGFGGAARELVARGVDRERILRLGYPRNTADIREALAAVKARAQDLDAVVLVATYKPAATFIRKAKDLGLRLVFTAVSADTGGLAEELVEAGPKHTEDVVLTQVVPVPTSAATAIVRYRKTLEAHAPGEKPGSTSLEAWIGAQIFLEALARAGRELDSEKLVAALEGMNGWDLGVGTPITFGPTDHQASDKVWGWALQPDGTWLPEGLD